MSDIERERIIRLACTETVSRGHQITSGIFGIEVVANHYQITGRECCALAAAMVGRKTMPGASLVESIAGVFMVDKRWVSSFINGFDDRATRKQSLIRGEPSAYEMGYTIAEEFIG